jgi:hypothetical protein
MKSTDKRTELLLKGVALGTEFALSVIALIFLGYFIGSRISELMAVVGMFLGATLGLVAGLYLLVKHVS